MLTVCRRKSVWGIALILSLVTVPLLTFQGTDDETVPRAVNDRFMRLAGEGGTYVLVDGADHVLAWNVDPEGYHDQIKDFVKELEKG